MVHEDMRASIGVVQGVVLFLCCFGLIGVRVMPCVVVELVRAELVKLVTQLDRLEVPKDATGPRPSSRD